MATTKYTDMAKPLESQFTYWNTGFNKPMYDSWMNDFNSSSTHPDAVAYRAKQYSDKYASVVTPDGKPIFDSTFYNGLATGTIPQTVADTQVKNWATDLLAKDPNINWNLSGGVNEKNKTFVAERNKLLADLPSNRNYVNYNKSKTEADKVNADAVAAAAAAKTKADADAKAMLDADIAASAAEVKQKEADDLAYKNKWDTIYSNINTDKAEKITNINTAPTGALPTGDVKALTTDAVKALTTDAVKALSTSPTGALPTSSTGALSTAQTGALSTAPTGALSTAPTGMLNSTIPNKWDAIYSGIDSDATAELTKITTPSIGALTTGDVKALSTSPTGALPTSSTGALSTAQTGALSTAPTGALSTAPTGMLNSTIPNKWDTIYSNISSDATAELNKINTPSIGALTTGDVKALSTSPTGALSTSSTGALSTAPTGALSTSPTGALSTAPTGALATGAVKALPTTPIASIGALTSDTLKALTDSQAGTKLTAADVGITLDENGKPKVQTADISSDMIKSAVDSAPTNIKYNADGSPIMVTPNYSTVATSALDQITADKVTAPIVDRTGTQSAADIAKLVDAAKSVDVNVTPDSLVSNRLSGLLSKNNPYIQQAVNAANLQSSRRGMLNTGAAAGFAQDAAIKNALPIAQADAATIAKANELNAAAKNALINTGLDLKSKGLISDTGNNVTLNTTQAKLTLDASNYDVANKLTADTFNATALNKLVTDNNAILNAAQKDAFDTWSAMAQADTLSQSNTYQMMVKGQLDALIEGAKDANLLNTALVNGNINVALNMKKAITDALAADTKAKVDAATAANKAVVDAETARTLADVNATAAGVEGARLKQAAADKAVVDAETARVLANVNATAAEVEGARLKQAAADKAVVDAKAAVQKAAADRITAADAAKYNEEAAANKAAADAETARVLADVNATAAEVEGARLKQAAADKALVDAKAAAQKAAADRVTAADTAKYEEEAAANKAKTEAEAATLLDQRATIAATAAANVAKETASTLANVNATAAEKEGARLKQAAADKALVDANAAVQKAKDDRLAAADTAAANRVTAADTAKYTEDANKAKAEEERITKILESQLTQSNDKNKTNLEMILNKQTGDQKVDSDVRALIAGSFEDIRKYTADTMNSANVSASAKTSNINSYTAKVLDQTTKQVEAAYTAVGLMNSDAAKAATKLLTSTT
jgi:hypothetical protein